MSNRNVTSTGLLTGAESSANDWSAADSTTIDNLNTAIKNAIEAGLPTKTAGHLVYLRNLQPSTEYHYEVVSGAVSTSDATLATKKSNVPDCGAITDTFNDNTINKPTWTLRDPLSDSSAVEASGVLTLSVASGTSHDLWTGVDTMPRYTQACSNTDFVLQAKFNSTFSADVQMHGIHVVASATEVIRFDFLRANGDGKLLAAEVVSGVENTEFNIVVTTVAYLRVTRASDLWTVEYSADGQSWTTAGSFTYAMTVAEVGLSAGNGGTNPSYDAIVDHFRVTNTPVSIGSLPAGMSNMTAEIYGTYAIFKWDTTGNDTGLINYGLSPSYGLTRYEPNRVWLDTSGEGILSRTVNINTVAFNSNDPVEVLGRDDLHGTLQTSSDTAGLFTFTHTTNTSTYIVINIYLRRNPANTVTGATGFELVLIQNLVSVEMYDCGVTGNTVVAVDATGKYSASVRVASNNSGNNVFQDFYRSNIDITQTRTTGTLVGGVIMGFENEGTGSFVLDNVTLDTGTFDYSDIGTTGIDCVDGAGNITLRRQYIVRSITGTHGGALNDDYGMKGVLHFRSTGTFTREFGSTIEVYNLTFDGNANGPYGLYTNQPIDASGPIYGENCTTSSEINSVGGLVIAINEGADTTLTDAVAVNCKNPFGTVVYASNGASITYRMAIGIKCSSLDGMVYKGGDGNMSGQVTILIGCFYNSTNTHTGTDNHGSLVRAHQQTATADEDGTLDLGVLITRGNEGMLDSPNAKNALIVLNDHATYSLDATIGTWFKGETVTGGDAIAIASDDWDGSLSQESGNVSLTIGSILNEDLLSSIITQSGGGSGIGRLHLMLNGWLGVAV